MSNRLAKEPSPYLQQHAGNPVDWWPWGETAFAEAKRRDVPVFVSIGYATCHWCHVMAHESFEDADVARAMNDAFVNIKVDREERPDVDEAYMHVCQAMTGSGGWPLNVVTTPDRRPFFAATYIPKTSRHGRIGMLELVPRIVEAWQTKRDALAHQADHIVQAIETVPDRRGDDPDASTLATGSRQLAARFDATHGGFGGAPKFPSPHQVRFLLRRHLRGDGDALAMATRSLDAMAAGGIHDHVGGGFHRYSTDAHWLLPHFEKMLYDQAGHLAAYAEAYAVAGHAAYKDIVAHTVAYQERDLRHTAGAFFAAEDADSEGEEGLFYTWTADELDDLLGADAPLVRDAYGVQDGGNFHEEATRRPSGRNILHRVRSDREVAAHHARDEATVAATLDRARSLLLKTRARRVRPLRDEKILTDWNGLAIHGLSVAAVCCNEPRYARLAEEAASFVLDAVRVEGRLRHRWRDGQVDEAAFLDDHAFLLLGLVHLYDATLDWRWVDAALEVAEALVAFRRPDGALATATRRDVPTPAPSAYDGAHLSGQSAAVEGLWRLGRLTAEPRWEDEAWTTVRAFAAELAAHPSAFTGMLCGVDAMLAPSQEIVIAGPPGDARTVALLKAARGAWRPERTLVLREGARASWLADYGADGEPAAYVCRDFACQRPVADARDLRAQLG